MIDSIETDLIPRKTLEDLCAHRQRAIDLYRQGFELLAEAQREHSAAAQESQCIDALPERLHRDIKYNPESAAKLVAHMITRIDKNMWTALLTSTRLWSLMDDVERRKFETVLQDSPPPVSVDAVLATMTRLMADGGMIFRRGLVSAFQDLSREYKSHGGFKLGDRIVLTWAVRYDTLCDSFDCHSAENMLRDVDRVMHVLDGKPAPDYQQGLCAALRTAFREYRETKSTRASTPYWDARFFKNGNIHLWFMRPDLRDKANKMIAEHFGLALGNDRGR